MSDKVDHSSGPDEIQAMRQLIEQQRASLELLEKRFSTLERRAQPHEPSQRTNRPVNESGPRSTRRNVLRAGAAVVGASVAVAGLGSEPVAANNDDPVKVGGAHTGTSATSFAVTGLGPALDASTTQNAAVTIRADSDGNLGKSIQALSSGNGGRSVDAVATGNLAVGVYSVADGAAGVGVRGEGSGIGILGKTVNSNGAAIAAEGRISVVPHGEAYNSAPVAPIHVKQSGSTDPVELLLQLESDVPPQQVFLNNTTGAKWFFAMTSDDEFKISRDGTGGVEAKFFQNGNLQIGGSLIQSSDENIKHDFADVDGQAILDAVEAMPVRTWRYDSSPDVVHMGPTAQDFRAAFGLGDSPVGIAAVDADGVALASIRALRAENRALRASLDALRDEVAGSLENC